MWNSPRLRFIGIYNEVDTVDPKVWCLGLRSEISPESMYAVRNGFGLRIFSYSGTSESG